MQDIDENRKEGDPIDLLALLFLLDEDFKYDPAEDWIHSLVKQLSDQLGDLHSRGVAHRGVRADVIEVSGIGNAKLTLREFKGLTGSLVDNYYADTALSPGA